MDNRKSHQPNNHHDEIVGSFGDFEQRFRQNYPLAWWMALVGPVVITACLLTLIYAIQGPEVAYSYVAAAASAFFLFGRFIILLGNDEPDPEKGMVFLKHLDAKNLFCMLTYLDVMVAMFVAFHMGILFRIPWAGKKIAGVVSDGQFILRKQPWIRRAAFLGLVGFVIFPTSTTGSVGGSIFGRLLGMKRWRVVFAIMLGSVLGNGLMLLFAKQITKYVGSDSWALRIGGVVAMLVALFFFERKYKKLKREYLSEETESVEPQQAPPSQPDHRDSRLNHDSLHEIANP